MTDVLVVGGIFREVLNGDTEPTTRYGGSGLTAAVAAARFGAKVALASYVGDEDDTAVRAELRIAGVFDNNVVTLPGASGTFVFPTHESSERPWPMYRPAEAVPNDLSLQLPSARVVVAFGLPDFDPVASGWLDHLGADVSLIWDRQGWLSRARDSAGICALAPTRKIYVANEREAMEDASSKTIEEAFAKQPPSGFTSAVIKRGIRGVVVLENSEHGIRSRLVNAFPVQTESTIGSGDIFTGAFASLLSKGYSLSEAARWGCAASAVGLVSGSNLLHDTALRSAELLTEH